MHLVGLRVLVLVQPIFGAETINWQIALMCLSMMFPVLALKLLSRATSGTVRAEGSAHESFALSFESISNEFSEACSTFGFLHVAGNRTTQENQTGGFRQGGVLAIVDCPQTRRRNSKQSVNI